MKSDTAIGHIANDSVDSALRVMNELLEVGNSLGTFSERGRLVPELPGNMMRELFVYQ